MSTDPSGDNENSKNKKRPLFSKRLLIIFLIVIAQIGLVAGVFAAGYSIGRDVGKKDAAVTTAFNGINSLIGNISNPFRSATGKVDAISKDSITVESSSGEKKSAKITNNTKITRRTEAKNVDEIKKGMRVSVFFDETASEPTAVRIVINE